MESHSIRVDDIDMRWEEAGEGTPVVFIHGIPTCPRLWRHVVPQIASARCLAWEMVGYGASISVGKTLDISVSRQAEYLVSWLKAIGLQSAVLVGHDLGGGVAQIAAVRHRQFVSGLVLMNAICYDSWPIPMVKITRAAGPLAENLPNAVFKVAFEQFISMGHDRPSMIRESLEEHWQHYEEADGAAAFVRQIESLDVRDTLAISNGLPELSIPARLVWGAADTFQKIGYGYRLAHDLKCPLNRIEDGKHFIPEDHPEKVAETINSLLSQTA